MDSLASEEIRRLQEQNSALRAVVAQMRKDMEGLGHLLVLPHAEAPVQPPYQESSASKGNTAGAVSALYTNLDEFLHQCDKLYTQTLSLGSTCYDRFDPVTHITAADSSVKHAFVELTATDTLLIACEKEKLRISMNSFSVFHFNV